MAVFKDQWYNNHKVTRTAKWHLFNGDLDEYLPIFKVTFKDNGQGGYYWVSSEMILPGAPIPEEALGLSSDNSEDLPSTQLPPHSETTTDIISSTDTEQATDGTSATDVQQTPDDGDAASLWGIVIGWGCVAVALAVGAGLLLKRYKK